MASASEYGWDAFGPNRTLRRRTRTDIDAGDIPVSDARLDYRAAAGRPVADGLPFKTRSYRSGQLAGQERMYDPHC